MTDMTFTEEWLAEYCKRNPQRATAASTAPQRDCGDKPKRSKYGNRKTEANGIVFDSKREADRYTELMTMLRAGEIYGVFRQHPFRLPGGVVYRADFVILNRDGSWTVEDAKGVRTKEYGIKKRQMRECLGVEIREV